MNTHISYTSKILLVALALLGTGAVASAQKDIIHTIPYKFFVEAGVGLVLDNTRHDVSDDGGGTENFIAPSAAIGWRVNNGHKFQFEISRWSGSGNVSENEDIDFDSTQLLLSYSYCIMLGGGRVEFRLTPAIGVCQMEVNKTYHYDTDSQKTSGSALCLGGGIGLTYNFYRQFYADLGVRIMARQGLSREDGTNYDIGPTNVGAATFAIGFKF